MDKKAIVKALEEAIELVNENPTEFKKRIAVTMEHQQHHQTLFTDFNVVYTCPKLGEVIRHTDAMLWNEDQDIIEQGLEAHEIKNFDDFKDFTASLQTVVKNEKGEWIALSKMDSEIQSLGVDLGITYTELFKVEEFIPDWKQNVINKVTEWYS